MNATEYYKQTAISTQSKGQIVVLLYEEAIKSLRLTQQHIQSGDMELKNHSIAKAKDIIFELNQALDLEKGGPLAQNLRKLYNFLWRHLGQVNIQNDAEGIHKAIHILEDLAGAWKKIASE